MCKMRTFDGSSLLKVTFLLFFSLSHILVNLMSLGFGLLDQWNKAFDDKTVSSRTLWWTFFWHFIDQTMNHTNKCQIKSIIKMMLKSNKKSNTTYPSTRSTLHTVSKNPYFLNVSKNMWAIYIKWSTLNKRYVWLIFNHACIGRNMNELVAVWWIFLMSCQSLCEISLSRFTAKIQLLT